MSTNLIARLKPIQERKNMSDNKSYLGMERIKAEILGRWFAESGCKTIGAFTRLVVKNTSATRGEVARLVKMPAFLDTYAKERGRQTAKN